MFAAMALHLHPELEFWQPALESEDITFMSEFGKPFPETVEESRERLGIKDEWDDYESDTILARNTMKGAYREIPFEFDDASQSADIDIHK